MSAHPTPRAQLWSATLPSALPVIARSGELPEPAIIGSALIYVMREGRMAGELSREEATQEDRKHLLAGRE